MPAHPHLNHRPLSPHLQVYRLPLTAMLSISHRMTGVVLALGLVAIAGLLATAAAGEAPFTLLLGLLSSWLGRVGLWLWIYALCFHACHGVRHLLWDTGRGLDKAVQLRHNLIEFGLSVLLTAGAFAFTEASRIMATGA